MLPAPPRRPATAATALLGASLLAVTLLAAAACEPIYGVTRSFVFQPERASRSAHDEPPADAERWWLDVEGGRVEAWYLPALAAARPGAGASSIGPSQGRAAPITASSLRPVSGAPGPAVIFAHGNAELIDDYPEQLAAYRAMGLAVLLPEYRSYGRSGGAPSEAALLADFAHFYDRLVDRPEIDGARVVFHGRSLGGGVLGALSAQRLPAALVLESTFTNVPDLASRWFAPMGALPDRFDTRGVLQHASTPALILHGDEDDVVPFAHAVELHRVAWDSRLVAFHAGHQVPHDSPTYWASIRALLIEAGVLEAPPATADTADTASRAGPSRVR